jgi:hypothetical protein
VAIDGPTRGRTLFSPYVPTAERQLEQRESRCNPNAATNLLGLQRPKIHHEGGGYATMNSCSSDNIKNPIMKRFIPISDTMGGLASPRIPDEKTEYRR